MADTIREKIVENLAVGSAVGFLVLVVAALALVSSSRSSIEEGEALAPSSSAIAPNSVDDPAFDRVYKMINAGVVTYGAVLTIRSPEASALVGAIFSPNGELRELRYLGACASRLPAEAKDAIAGFVDADDALERAAEAVRAVSRDVNGSSEAGS